MPQRVGNDDAEEFSGPFRKPLPYAGPENAETSQTFHNLWARALHLFRLRSRFFTDSWRNPHQNSDLRRGQGRALHLFSVTPKPLIYLTI